jgi:pilus assembly protein CpaB
MRSRGLAVAVAFLLAITATMAVFLYVKGVQQEAEVGGEEVEVVVSKEDIPVGTELDDLLARGAFQVATVDEEDLVPGGVTSLTELQGQRTSQAILAGEQITSARLQGSGAELPGGLLGIPAGHQALMLPLETPRALGGQVRKGDRVTIYATFDDPEVTVVLVPEVQVLRVSATDPAIAQDSSNIGLLTLALKDRDAGRVVFAQERGKVWLSLLPPNSDTPKRGVVSKQGVTRR